MKFLLFAALAVIVTVEVVRPEEYMSPEKTAQAAAAVAPKKVRTMIVLPDGTLVSRETLSPASDMIVSSPQPDTAMKK